MNRMPALSESDWNDERRVLAEEIIHGPRGSLLPPFEPLLRSPQLMSHVQKLGEYLRYSSAIGQRLTELAILVTARNWNQTVESAIHAPLAIKEGINSVDVENINHKIEPKHLAEDEFLIYSFCQDLHQNRQVSQKNWDGVIELFGEKGVMDLVGIDGYYTLLSMVMNSALTSAPESELNLVL